MSADDNKHLSRREVIAGAGIGLAAAAAIATPALAETAQGWPAQGLVDPTTKYPRPPYQKQSQPWPGLAGKMNPRPDHGETSYHGSGRLAGRKALITGGDSGMGRAAAIAYAREGADVAINYFLRAEEPDAQEVIALIKAEGRIGLAHSRRFARRKILPASWSPMRRQADWGDSISSSTTPGRQQSRESIMDLTSR